MLVAFGVFPGQIQLIPEPHPWFHHRNLFLETHFSEVDKDTPSRNSVSSSIPRSELYLYRGGRGVRIRMPEDVGDVGVVGIGAGFEMPSKS